MVTQNPCFYSATPTFLSDCARNLGSTASILGPGPLREECLDVLLRAERDEIPLERAAATLMSAMTRQMIQPFHPRLYGTLGEVFRDEKSALGKAAAPIERFLGENPSAASSPIWEIDLEESTVDPKLKVWIDGALTTSTLGMAMLHDLFDFSLTFPKPGWRRMKFFPEALLLEASRLYFGENATPIEFNADLTQLEELQRMQANQGKRPVCLDPQQIHTIDGFEKAHPSYVANHDLSHAASLGEFDRRTRRDLALLSMSVSRLPEALLNPRDRDVLAARCLDGPRLPHGRGDVFRRLFADMKELHPELLTKPVRRAIFKGLECDFATHERAHRILAAFVEELVPDFL
jgi:hypothetical protein